MSSCHKIRTCLYLYLALNLFITIIYYTLVSIFCQNNSEFGKRREKKVFERAYISGTSVTDICAIDCEIYIYIYITE